MDDIINGQANETDITTGTGRLGKEALNSKVQMSLNA